MKENFEDTQGVIRSGISKKTRDELGCSACYRFESL